MKDYHSQFAGREMIVGWISHNGGVKQVQGFYCQNGGDLDGRWNILNDEGDTAPGPHNNCPMYFAPEVGSSIDARSYHLTRTVAVDDVREKLLRERAIIDEQLRALDEGE